MCLPLKPYKIEREWKHAGLSCAVVQAREAGHRCGYVRVPSTHPMFGRSYDGPDVEVHGGLTFAELEPCTHEDGSGWWFGFDCHHWDDAGIDPSIAYEDLPSGAQVMFDLNRQYPIAGTHYWQQVEVERETEWLAFQLAALSVTQSTVSPEPLKETH